MKRFFFNGLLIICILSVLVLPAFATITNTTESDDIVILKQPTDFFFNNRRGTVSILVSGDVSYQWERLDGNTWVALSTTVYEGANSNTFVYVYHGIDFSDVYLRCRITSNIDGSVVYSRVVLGENAPTNIFNFVGSCLKYVTSYISLIVNSLVTPGAPLFPLLPVLAIGIAVAFILIVIRITKAFSWGV